MPSKLPQIVTRVPLKTKQRWRKIADDKGMTMNDLIIDAVESKYPDQGRASIREMLEEARRAMRL